MATTTAKKNGIATPVNGATKTAASTAKAAAKTNGTAKKAASPVVKAVNVSERVKKIAQLQELTKQREKLLETLENLELFEFGSDKMLDSLTIVDSTGREFSSSNSNLIAALSEHFKTLLQEKIQFVESKIVEATL